MSDLIPYNKQLIVKGQGLVNFGNTCYFNSLLQCLMSCTSIFEVLNKNRNAEHIKANRLVTDLLDLWDTALRGEPIMQKNRPVWEKIISVSQNQKTKIHMDIGGQHDAHDGLMMFFEAMKNVPEVLHLFEHRYKYELFCESCNSLVTETKELNTIFDVQPDLKTAQLEKFKDRDPNYDKPMQLKDFLRQQNGYVDADHICPKCQFKGEKFKTATLTMVPEIIVVLFKKYDRKQMTQFPISMEFSTNRGTKQLCYQLIAQSEHSGSMNGGHYWAICNRKDEDQILNDSSVSTGSLGPTENTYMAFYHYIETKDV